MKRASNIFLFLLIFFFFFLPSLFYLKNNIFKTYEKKESYLNEKSIYLDREFAEIKVIVCNYSLFNRRTIYCFNNSIK